MTKPQTWEEKRDWLEQNFGTVTTRWWGPEHFVSNLDGIEVSNTVARSSIKEIGITGEESIRNVYNRVTGLKSDEHIILNDEKRVTIDPQTLKINPWQPPAANAA